MESFVALLTGVVVLVTAVLGAVLKLHRNVQEIHVLVNSRMTEALTRIDQLADTLDQAGIELPDRPERK